MQMTAKDRYSRSLLRRPVAATAMLMVFVSLAACSHGDKEEVSPGASGATQRVTAPVKKEVHRMICKAKGSGRWFPGSKRELESMVNGYVKEAKVPELKNRIVAAIAPHAGYIYSGKVAGYAFRAIKDNVAAGNAPDVVVVLGFSHRAGFRGVALLEEDAIETPMGQAALDKEAGKFLVDQSKRIVFNTSAHGTEHSAENEIPFVQGVLPEAKLVVGLIGDHDGTTIRELVKALNALAMEKKVLVVASTDMLHHANYDLVTRTDRATLKKVAAMDHAGIAKSWNYSNQVFCGIGPVLAVMQFAESQGCKKATVLHYRNSGDDFPESSGQWVVGYGAVVFETP